MPKVQTVEYVSPNNKPVKLQVKKVETVIGYIGDNKGTPVRRIAWDTQVSPAIINKILQVVPEGIALVKAGYVPLPERGQEPAWTKYLSTEDRAQVFQSSPQFDPGNSLVTKKDIAPPSSVREKVLRDEFSGVSRDLLEIAMRMGPRAGRRMLFGYKRPDTKENVVGIMDKLQNMAEVGQSALDKVGELDVQVKALRNEMSEMRQIAKQMSQQREPA